MAHRLAASTSPYLLQHADNPVDWWPWSPEALAEAKRRDVPILLSVGYAACHWCHVMAPDSFESDDVAAVLNRDFVSIKVDREERPDIDAVYMQATIALTGQGGWPMTCLLTPDGAPFFAGTFLPKAQFLDLLASATAAWTDRRADVDASATRIVDALSSLGSSDAPSSLLDSESDQPALSADDLDAAAAALARTFDLKNGGFGGAPKFPPSMVLEFLLRHHERTGSPESLDMVARTARAMAYGGIYDQLAGGFARYSVDATWTVPHFEKMLYDNALLLRVYLHWWRRSDDPLADRVARETADFLLRDLGTSEGGFASALDADTDGVEGLTYAWKPSEFQAILGDDASVALAAFGVTDAGTFEHGSSTLQFPAGAEPTNDGSRDWLQRVKAALLDVRNRRPQPARDDKVVTAWNGLAIAALVEAAQLLPEPRYLAAATATAELLLATHVVDGRLRRMSRDGVASDATGVAEDYGDFAEGLLLLHQATAEPRWLAAAGELLDIALEHFPHPDGGFFDTADDAETLVQRPRDPGDNATPSGQSALISALVTYSALAGSPRHRAAAESALRTVAPFGVREPRFLGWALAAAEGALAGPVQVAVVGDGEASRAGAVRGTLTETAWRLRPPGGVVVAGRPDADGVPLLAYRPLVDGSAAAYVCYGMVCDAPVSTAAALAAALTSSGRSPD